MAPNKASLLLSTIELIGLFLQVRNHFSVFNAHAFDICCHKNALSVFCDEHEDCHLMETLLSDALSVCLIVMTCFSCGGVSLNKETFFLFYLLFP